MVVILSIAVVAVVVMVGVAAVAYVERVVGMHAVLIRWL